MVQSINNSYSINNDASLSIYNVNASTESYYTCGFQDPLGNYFTRDSYNLLITGKIKWWFTWIDLKKF